MTLLNPVRMLETVLGVVQECNRGVGMVSEYFL